MTQKNHTSVVSYLILIKVFLIIKLLATNFEMLF